MNSDILKLLQDRYFLKDEKEWKDLAHRVSALYPEIEHHIQNMEFIPSSPTLMNANTKGERNGTLSSCFPMNINDSMESIMDSMKEAALVTKACGGVGYDFSVLRGKNEGVKGTGKNSGGVMSFIGIYDAVLEGVRQGVRRGAGMSLLSITHPQILDFIDAKKDIKSYNRSNFSVKIPNWFYETLEKTPDKVFETINIVDKKHNELIDSEGKKVTYKMLWDKIINNAWLVAEPGIINEDYILERSTLTHIDNKALTNPCLHPDTKVFLANDKGIKTIKQLADEGKDVDIYTFNTKGEIEVAKLLNPRLTEKNVDVYKITFDSGDSIVCTKNHEFITSDGFRISVKDMQKGTSIKSCSLVERSLSEAFIFMKKTSGQNYMFFENNGNLKAIHRIIAESAFSEKINELIKNNKRWIVHHKNYNGKDNNVENLEVMSNKEHCIFHSKDMIGDKNAVFRIKDKAKWRSNISKSTTGLLNPNAKDISNEVIIDSIKNIVKLTFNNFFTKQMWLDLNLPNLNRSNTYRLKSISDYCDIIKKTQKIHYIKTDLYNKIMKKIYNLNEGKYNYYFNEDTYDIIINKKCEICDNEFNVDYDHRHVTFCSKKCYVKFYPERFGKGGKKLKQFMFNDYKFSERYLNSKNTKNRISKTLKAFDIIRSINLETTVNIKKEYKLINNIVRPSNVFCPSVEYLLKHKNIKTSEELITEAQKNINNLSAINTEKVIGRSFNHKITNIEYAGKSDVYDGTVESTHNFLIGCFKNTDIYGRDSYDFVASCQCSEFVTTVPYTSCNLGSIDVSKFVENNDINWDKLKLLIRKSVRFLNSVIDNNIYPIDKIKETSHNSRPIGLGMMGFAHLLYKLGIPYNSNEAKELATKLMKTFTLYGMNESIEMAKEKGKSFKWYNEDVYIKANKRLFDKSDKYIPGLKDKLKKYGIYNSSISSIAPTGTISTLSTCSSGIEPIFGLVYTRKIETGDKQYTEIFVVDPIFEKHIETNYEKNKEHIYKYISNNKGSCQGCKYISEEDQKIFVTAGDITSEWHLEILEPFVNYVSLSVSKTVNLPKTATREDISKVYIDAYKNGIIGVTVYRDGCREGILVHNDKEDIKSDLVDRREAPKRPKDLDCDIKIVKIKSETIAVLVGKLKGMVYEIFVAVIDEKDKENLEKYKVGIIRKIKTGHYALIYNDNIIIDNLGKFGTTVERSLARFISMGLRHGVPLKFIVEQLNKSDDFMAFDKSVSRILKQYIKDGETYEGEVCPECKSKLIYFDGCVKCSQCFYSRCG